MKKRAAAILLAGGSGERMGAGENKIFLPINGQAMFLSALRTFVIHPRIRQIILVIRPEDEEQIRLILKEERFAKKKIAIVYGGITRRQSVASGLKAARGRLILIHDLARPFVTEAEIEGTITALRRALGSIAAIPVTETLLEQADDGSIRRLTGGELWAALTPQAFHARVLRSCHRRLAEEEEVTDDASMLERLGYKIAVVRGAEINQKMTMPFDLATNQSVKTIVSEENHHAASRCE